MIFKGLLRASLDNPELVRPHIAPGDGIPSHAALRAIADALWSAGARSYKSRWTWWSRCGVFVEKVWPAGSDAMLSRTIVVAERGATVTIVEDLTSEGTTPRIAIPHVDVYAGPGAKVRYVAIRRFAPGVVDLGFQRFRSASDSDLAVHNVFAGEGSRRSASSRTWKATVRP